MARVTVCVKIEEIPKPPQNKSHTCQQGKHSSIKGYMWTACCICMSGKTTVSSVEDYNVDYHLSEGGVGLDSISKPTIVETSKTLTSLSETVFAESACG